MKAVVLLGRVWGFHVAIPLAAAGAVCGYGWWEGGTSIPTVEPPVPMPILLPPLLVIALSWTLVERWPASMQISARRPAVVRLARYFATLVVGSGAACVASLHSPGLETLSLTAIGIGLAGMLAPFIGRWLWMPLVVAGYGWLQYGVTVVDGDYLAHDVGWAVVASVAGCLTSIAWPLNPAR
jgi:hypothetical protein